MRRVVAVLSLSLFLGLSLGPEVAHSQDDPSPLPGVFGEVIDVRVINIEVVVTDKSGVQVTGLGPDDFRLLVDGQEQPIDYFTEVRGGIAVERPDDPAAEVPAILPGKPVGTSYLVFIDEFFSVARDRDRVLNSMIDDLGYLGPEDRMAIVAYNGRDLEMLSTWSQSTRALERAMREAMGRRTYGLQRISETREVDSNAVFSAVADFGDGDLVDPLGFFQTELRPEERFYVSRLGDQVERSVTAAAATLRSFSSPPGRKVMLILSGGWPFVPADFILAEDRFTVLDRVGPEGSQLFSVLSDTANLLGYTLYPVDVPGFNASPVDVERTTPSLRPFGLDTSFLRQQDRQYSLRYLADETGGKALLNADRTNVLDIAAGDTRSYYWLGFVPERVGDNERHDIRVEVRGPGFKVRSREGYLDSSRQREVTMSVESTLLFGNTATEDRLAVELGEPQRAGLRRMKVPVAIDIPASELTFVPAGGRYATEVEMRFAVMDAGGGRAPIPVIPLQLEGDGPPAAGVVTRYETTLKLRRSQHRLVVALFDKASGRILSGSAVINP